MTREYWAVVHGTVPACGTIDAAIGRDRRNPLRFSVATGGASKAARTGYRRAGAATCGDAPGSGTFSWVVCRLETGRTHQIRVHLESIGHPLVGDRLYRAGRPPVPAASAAGKPTPAWSTFARQALHACRLQLLHPASREALCWFAPPPADLARLMTDMGWRGLDRPQSRFE
jgi:23S rRNA pseudouridine1911/1915/1917 synthase